MPKNIFVLGLDAGNRRRLEDLPGSADYRFHPLLSTDELLSGDIDLSGLLGKARDELDAFDGAIDAIVGYWDFPVSSMVPILCQERSLPTAPLEAVLKCEHKYWSRLEQRNSIDEYPAFATVGLRDRSPPDDLPYPMWIKPVKAFSSELAFRVADDDTFRSSLADIRAGIDRVGSAFDIALSYVDLPEEIAQLGGAACMAEEAVSGQQVTVEGFHDGATAHVYGVIEAHNYDDTPSFRCYLYPSRLPDDVVQRLSDISRRVIEHIGLTTVFNIEYFWDRSTGALHLLEINPRQSQSHARLFEQVDGLPNHHCMIEFALGRVPTPPARQGQYPMAAKWFYRRFSDGLVQRSPTDAEIESVERDIPGVHVEVEAREGVRLSEMPEQDSYSYNLAVVHVGGADEHELRDKYERCLEALTFDFQD